MTLAEKRALLIKEIQEMPEEVLDKLLAAISSKDEENKRTERITDIVKKDFKRYHNVFKALS